MIISAILSLRYNIPHRASLILNPSLNLLIKSSMSSSGGHPTPAFHIAQDLSTISEYLQLEPLIENDICCPQCFFLNGLTESVITDQPHCQCHNEPNEHDPPCTQSLGKFINSFKPCTQNTTNMKEKSIPKKHFIYQPFKNWLSRFLQKTGIMEIMHQHQQSQISEGSPKCKIWDGLVWRCFTGTRNINDPPFISNPGALVFSIWVDWFNAHGNSTRLASIGPTMLICLNLPQMPLIKELKEIWQGCHFSPTSTGPSGSFIRVAILTDIADVVAMHKLTGFIPHSGNHFCNFCTIHKAQIEEIVPLFKYTRSYQNYKSAIVKWLWATPKQQQEIFSEYRVRYSILEDLPYWDATRIFNIDIMNNLILGILKDCVTFKLCIPESKSKIYFRSNRKSNDTNSSDSDSMTSNSSLDKFTLREAHSLRRHAAKIINESLPTTSPQQNYFPMPIPHMQHPSSGSAEIPSFDAD
ncbi:hypothetical protein O181_015360 [Austropuccinia psidii MF-1]|uniref:Uncharacterized protein n=1 Tax=Austropuccinia psidii MF-1 TaxID=1389203 RepID=A0A9Q3GQV9_9BASI|nr:hypothetical protein [Austropuccinia psidii MF-1]